MSELAFGIAEAIERTEGVKCYDALDGLLAKLGLLLLLGVHIHVHALVWNRVVQAARCHWQVRALPLCDQRIDQILVRFLSFHQFGHQLFVNIIDPLRHLSLVVVLGTQVWLDYFMNEFFSVLDGETDLLVLVWHGLWNWL